MSAGAGGSNVERGVGVDYDLYSTCVIMVSISKLWDTATAGMPWKNVSPPQIVQ